MAEDVLFSDLFTKINRRDKSQDRAFLVTNLAVYNLKPGNYGSCKRRIPLVSLEAVTMSQVCGCVVVWLCGCVVVWLCGCFVFTSSRALRICHTQCRCRTSSSCTSKMTTTTG